MKAGIIGYGSMPGFIASIFDVLCTSAEAHTTIPKEQIIRMVLSTMSATGDLMLQKDLTFYGTEAYHDRFAGRSGDQAFLLRLLDAANRAGIPVSVSIPIIRENMGQLAELRSLLDVHGAERCIYFLPNSKGRGKMMQDQRITLFQHLSLNHVMLVLYNRKTPILLRMQNSESFGCKTT